MLRALNVLPSDGNKMGVGGIAVGGAGGVQPDHAGTLSMRCGAAAAPLLRGSFRQVYNNEGLCGPVPASLTLQGYGSGGTSLGTACPTSGSYHE